MHIVLYSDNQKTLKKEDNFKTQVMTLNSPVSIGYTNCAVH